MTDLLFVVGHPTQFEAPFFAHIGRTAGPDAITVVFSESERDGTMPDPEISKVVDWGFDVRGGYASVVAPTGAGIRWAMRYLNTLRPSYVLVNGYHIGLHRKVTIACHLLRIPVGLRIDGALFATRPRWKQIAKRLIYPFLSKVYHRIFSVGTVTDEYLERLGVPRHALARFTYAIDVDRFRLPDLERRSTRETVRRRFGIPISSTVILAVAKFSTRETPWDLLAALPALPSSEWTVLLVGDGPDRPRIEETINAMGDSVRVIVPGYVSYPDLSGLYAAADIFVHAAKEEVWGVSVAEALAAGLPVIASDRVGSARDLVLEGVNGAIYPFGHSDRLVEWLMDVRSMIAGGRSFTDVNDHVLRGWDYDATWREIKAGISS